jgi:hypothetical protein
MPVRRRALSPAALIRSRAIQRGILGADRGWRILAIVIFGRRFLKRAFGRNPELLATEELKPGHLLQIETIPPPRRRERRRARRRG